MHLYEINAEIVRLMDLIEVDEETGEIITTEEIIEQLHALDMERSRILEYLAKLTLETRAKAAALKAEEDRLAKRRAALERKEARLLEVLDRECAGQKTDLGVATLRYRTTNRVEISDAAKAVYWLKRHKFRDCIRTRDPEVDKTAVRRLLISGSKIPGIALVTGQSCSLK